VSGAQLTFAAAPLAACATDQRCAVCGGVLIHQHRRGVHVSASSFGQLVHDLATKRMSAFDVDLGVWMASKGLLELFEEKRPGQVPTKGQASALTMLGEVLAHYRDCPRARVRLHPQSGLYRLDVDLRRPVRSLADLQLAVAVTDVRDPRRGGRFDNLLEVLLWMQATGADGREPEAVEVAGRVLAALGGLTPGTNGVAHP
jgi:hypothetical protein